MNKNDLEKEIDKFTKNVAMALNILSTSASKWVNDNKEILDNLREICSAPCSDGKEKKPIKRLMTAKELFEAGATHIDLGNGNIFALIYTDGHWYIQERNSELTEMHDYKMKTCHWTSDRKTWNDFYIEE
jgi:hypothetical protein